MKMQNLWKPIVLTLVCFGLASHYVFGHDNQEAHESQEMEHEDLDGDVHSDESNTSENSVSAKSSAQNDQAIMQIQSSYEANVKKIFEAKCFDCHGAAGVLPWYYKIPGVKWLMDSHMEEAKEHIDMQNGYPFKGHGNNLSKDLEDIGEEVSEGEMPPWYYRFFESGVALTAEEKAAVKEWVTEGRSLLQQ